MPAMESFSDYLRREHKTPRSIEACREDAYDLIDQQSAGLMESQKAFKGLALDCKHEIDVTARALARAHPQDNLGIPQITLIKKGFGDVLVNFYNQAIQIAHANSSVKIDDYYDGKTHKVFGKDLKITISKAAWEKLVERGGNPEQIKGILAGDPIDIRNVGKFKGIRCIKPEPYGWIFSTSSAARLVDTTTSTTTWVPAALNFTEVLSGH